MVLHAAEKCFAACVCDGVCVYVNIVACFELFGWTTRIVSSLLIIIIIMTMIILTEIIITIWKEGG